ncbi:MAG: type VI secretion system tube protein Hcp [Candidatus Rokubacteria bacterium]|nr:type VI secretion system tube protein Hcp [Candidatus Rokubacteria bacterium]
MASRRALAFLILIGSVALLGVALSTSPAWAFKAVAIITGNQGKIQGEITTKGLEGTIFVQAIAFASSTPFDATSGSPTGQRTSMPLHVVKVPDTATPQLLLAHDKGEVLTVEIRMFRPVTTGAVEHYFTIRLVNAAIVGVQASGDVNAPGGVLETISFVYQTITFTNLINGKIVELPY